MEGYTQRRNTLEALFLWGMAERENTPILDLMFSPYNSYYSKKFSISEAERFGFKEYQPHVILPYPNKDNRCFFMFLGYVMNGTNKLEEYFIDSKKFLAKNERCIVAVAFKPSEAICFVKEFVASI